MAGSDLQQQVTQLIAALQAATVDELRQIDPRALAELGDELESVAETTSTRIAPHSDDGLLRLHDIRHYLLNVVPESGLAPGEKASIEAVRKSGDDVPELHVDAFLHTEDDVEALVERGTIYRQYCRSCGGHNIDDVTFISHSFSLHQLRFLYKDVLPTLGYNRASASLLDVGARLGAVLYGGYCFSDIGRLVGVEMNAYFANVQRKTVARFSLGDRIEVNEANLADRPELLSSVDIVVLNNVFEYFGDEAYESRMWNLVRRHLVKSGTLVVSVPAMSNTDGWLESVEVEYPSAEFDDDEYASEAQSLHFYRVIDNVKPVQG